MTDFWQGIALGIAVGVPMGLFLGLGIIPAAVDALNFVRRRDRDVT